MLRFSVPTCPRTPAWRRFAGLSALWGSALLVSTLSACDTTDKAQPPASSSASLERASSQPAGTADSNELPDPGSDAQDIKAALLGLNRPPVEDEAPEKQAPEERHARRPRRPSKAKPSQAPAPALNDPGPETSSLSDGAFQSVITDWNGMKRCLASNSGRLGRTSGALRVAFTIRGDGQVIKSEVVETSNEDARAIAPCVERGARRLRFPAFAAASDEVEKTAKFVF